MPSFPAYRFIAGVLFIWLVASSLPASAAGMEVQIIAERHLLKRASIASARVKKRYGKYVVEIRLKAKAAKLIAELTRRNIGKRMQFIISGKVAVSALIQAPIEGGVIAVSGNFTRAEAGTMARKLR